MVRELQKNAYVCPECRILFSMDGTFHSSVVECPACLCKVWLGQSPISNVRVSPATLKSDVGVNNVAQSWDVELADDYKTLEASVFPWPVIVPAVLAGCALFVGLIMVLQDSAPEGVMRSSDTALTSIPENTSRSEVDRVPTKQEVEVVLQGLAAASSLEEVLKFLCDSDRAIISKLYNAEEFSFSAITDKIQVDYTEDDGYFVVYGVDDSRSPRTLVFKRDGTRLLIDWSASYGIGELSIDQIKEQKPQSPISVRVLVTKMEYYNEGYDSSRWQSYTLSFAGTNNYLIAYVARDSFMIHQLEPFGEVVVDQPYFLYIKSSTASKLDDRLVEIDSVAAKGWILKE